MYLKVNLLIGWSPLNVKKFSMPLLSSVLIDLKACLQKNITAKYFWYKFTIY